MFIKSVFLHFLVVSILVFSLLSAPILAHTTLLSSEPANGSVIQKPINDISLSFAGKIRLTQVSVQLDGLNVGDLDLSQQKKFSKQFLLPFAFTQYGHFQITWRGLGQDGHVLTGTFEFKKVKN